jgi:hypothetical protein
MGSRNQNHASPTMIVKKKGTADFVLHGV